MKLAQLIGGDGFDDVTHEEFNELIDVHSQALTDEDLAELTKSVEEETEDQEDPSQFSNAIDSSMLTYKPILTTLKK